MHEALISKGQVNGHPEQDKINSQFNCVLRHHACPNGKDFHSGGIGGDITFEKCARQLVEFEGFMEVRCWLFGMQHVFPTVARDALYRFDKIDWRR
jgi:hypothetical protein